MPIYLGFSKFEYCLAYDGDADRLLVHKKKLWNYRIRKNDINFSLLSKKKKFPK